ncbi:DUF3168 domain-containing protein [Phaeovulum vinaykumarii]|uniref:DUF3168 domain-containing protein n=1 Tax=Phaeovulum vinaykumarii TaxID=407234 RepID=UPI001F44CE73|nr:DUF3168 domain-containing protein [Phaeovulum vinaykumarii]
MRGTLIGAPAVVAHVLPDNIRAGMVRPDRLPCVVLGDARTDFLGCAAGSQRLARVFLTLHVWAQEDGADTAREIGAAIQDALAFGPKDTAEIAVDDWQQPRLVWLRDPQPELTLTHGAMALEAVVRWRV